FSAGSSTVCTPVVRNQLRKLQKAIWCSSKWKRFLSSCRLLKNMESTEETYSKLLIFGK
ncbi:hypothetical protein M9458_010325, partial [Cirrhinus mrigala]